MKELLHSNYFKPMKDVFDKPEKKQPFLSKPEKIKMYIDENGLLKIKGKRYMRLGKINLFDPVESKHISEEEFVGIIDTNTGEILCFDINKIYKEYIQSGIEHVETNDKKIYEITSQTKNIVTNVILRRKQLNNNIDFV